MLGSSRGKIPRSATEAARIVLPNAGLELEMRRGGIGRRPMRGTLRRRVPQVRQAVHTAEEILQASHADAPADVLRMQRHREEAAALVLGIELGAPIAEQHVGDSPGPCPAPGTWRRTGRRNDSSRAASGSCAGWRNPSPSNAGCRRPAHCPCRRSRPRSAGPWCSG